MGKLKVIRAAALFGALGTAIAMALNKNYEGAIGTVFAALSSTGLIKHE